MSRPAGRSRWWSRGRGLPAQTYATWAASAAAPGARPPRVLAWAESTGGFCIGTPGALSYSGARARARDNDRDDDRKSDRESGWNHVGWHEIERGGWNVETHQLSWRRYDGGRGSLELGEPGRLPELFRERVAASIVVEKFVALAGQRGVTITARRDLGADAAISWHASLSPGLTWDTEGVREAAAAAETELRAEYDLG